jgi:hypothetical protein
VAGVFVGGAVVGVVVAAGACCEVPVVGVDVGGTVVGVFVGVAVAGVAA